MKSYREQLDDHEARILRLEERLGRNLEEIGDPQAIEQVMKAVCWAWQVDRKNLTTGIRTQSVANAIGTLTKIFRDMFGMSYEDIGGLLHRDHSTLINHIRMHAFRNMVSKPSAQQIQRWATLYEEHGVTHRISANALKTHYKGIMEDGS